jgi:transposase
VCHRWYLKGQRPPGTADQRFTFAYIFAASEVETDNAFALILPEVHTGAMQEFLDRFAKTIPETDHVALFLDRAGWHGATALKVPDSITLVPLPAYSPELNPVERIWEYLKERYLSHRLLDDYDAIVDAASGAWNKLTAETGRLTSLTWLPWAPENGASQNL